MTLSMKATLTVTMAAFWDLGLSSLVDADPLFGGAYSVQHQGDFPGSDTCASREDPGIMARTFWSLILRPPASLIAAFFARKAPSRSLVVVLCFSEIYLLCYKAQTRPHTVVHFSL
jgi:hypothetical protein